MPDNAPSAPAKKGDDTNPVVVIPTPTAAVPSPKPASLPAAPAAKPEGTPAAKSEDVSASSPPPSSSAPGASASASASAAVPAASAPASAVADIPEPKVSPADAAEITISCDAVTSLLGGWAAAVFRRAMALTLSSGLAEVGGVQGSGELDTGEMLEEATRLFVLLLTKVPEDGQSAAGFAELLTGYGKALLGFVRRAGQRKGVLGAGVKGEEGQGGEAGVEDLEEQDDNEELAWTQLEAARVVFDRLVKEGEERYQIRLGDVHGCLGDLLLEGDAWEGAAREYEIAAGLLTRRRKAEVLYKRYLALRRDDAAKAVESLRESVSAFEEVESDEDTVKELREELQGFENAVLPALRKLQATKDKDKDNEEDTMVTVVQPRKRARKHK